MCCCLIDCVSRFERRNQALFIGLLDAIFWVSVAFFTIGRYSQLNHKSVLSEFQIFHDNVTATRLFHQDIQFRYNAVLWEASIIAVNVVLDMLLLTSAWWRQAWIPPVWCFGILIVGFVRIGTLVYFYDVHSFLVWDKGYWVLAISWICMMVEYFKELMEENNPKIELHLPLVRAVGENRMTDDKVPTLHEDAKDEEMRYLVLGYTNELNINLHMNKWEGIDYFGKIRHYVNEKSYYHV